MSRSDLAAQVTELRDVDHGEFQARVREEADRIKDGVRDGRLDNAAAIVGIEHELYGVDPTGALTRLPRRLLTLIGFEREVGLHRRSPTRAHSPSRGTVSTPRRPSCGRAARGGVGDAQVAYVRRQADTLVGGDFAEWTAPG